MKLLPFDDAWIVLNESGDQHVPLIALQYTCNAKSTVQLLPFGATSVKFLKDKLPLCSKTSKPVVGKQGCSNVYATSSQAHTMLIEHLEQELSWMQDRNVSVELESETFFPLVFCTFANQEGDTDEPEETCITAFQFCAIPERAHFMCSWLKSKLNDKVKILKDAKNILQQSPCGQQDKPFGPGATWLKPDVAPQTDEKKRMWIRVPSQTQGGTREFKTTFLDFLFSPFVVYDSVADFRARKRKMIQQEPEDILDKTAEGASKAVVGSAENVENAVGAGAGEGKSFVGAEKENVGVQATQTTTTTAETQTETLAKKMFHEHTSQTDTCETVDELEKLVKMFEDANWMLDPFDVEIEVDSKLGFWELNSLLSRITFEQKSRIPKGVFDGERCSICWRFGHLRCEECRAFCVCESCFQALKEPEVLCVRCVFDTQADDLDACLKTRLPLQNAL